MKIDFPLVSIVTSSFNDCKLLKETIINISIQTYPNFEYIVIDGGSTDGTLDLLRNERRIDHWISEPDRGIYDAWNKAIAISNGDYVAFLGAGDTYLDGGLNELIDLAMIHSSTDFIFGKVSVEGINLSPRLIGKAWSWNLFSRYMCTTHVGALHSRRLFERYGQFDVNYRIAGDYELLLRPGTALKTAFLDRPVAVMMAGGISQRNHRVLHEVKRAKLQHKTVSWLTAQYDFFWANLKLLIRNGLLR
jgi:glycosyltransferase involved in cell wall biosynthesis